MNDDDDSNDDKNKYACFGSEDTVFNDGKAQIHRNIYIGIIGCLVQVSNDIELDTIGRQFEL